MMIAWTLRSMGRLQEAVDIQLRLERERDELGEPDRYVFEEFEHLYRAPGNTAQVESYAQRRQSTKWRLRFQNFPGGNPLSKIVRMVKDR
jgi:hypothetical protein